MRRWLQRLLTAAGVLLLTLGMFWYANHLMGPVNDSGPSVRVNIPPGETTAGIAKRLKRAGAIRSALAFQMMVKVLGESKNIKAGEYQIPQSLGIVEIIDKLVAGDADAQWVVIPEGKTLSQIAVILEARRLAKSGNFMRAASRRPSSYGLDISVPRHSVDGYLMPDTYKFPRQISEGEIIRQMLRNWNAKVLRPHKALFSRSDLPVDKIVVMASMIEREARVPEDRPKIASVVRNRLKKGMKLQIDATVLYALRAHKSALSYADLKTKSPYNTYQNFGLPPGPICNPGVASVEAALQPAATPYLYYVAQPDGSHIFSRTAEEHRAAIARVKQMKGLSANAGR